jgi:hypothetical protein
MRLIGFLFKLILVAIVVLLVLQAEYKGRKLKTYVVEYYKSLTAKNEVVEEEEEVPATDALKGVKKETKRTAPVKAVVKEHKKVKQVKSDAVDIPDEDRQELQDMLEKEKTK